MQKCSSFQCNSLPGPLISQRRLVQVARVRAALAQATHEFFRQTGLEEQSKLQGSTGVIETVAGPMAFFMSAAKLDKCDVLVHGMCNFSLKNLARSLEVGS